MKDMLSKLFIMLIMMHLASLFVDLYALRAQGFLNYHKTYCGQGE